MKSILLIEDNESLARGLRGNLEFEGYDVLVAHDAAAGLRLARERHPHLILLDLMLPDQNGFRVLRELRAAGSTTPVLVLTALGEEADKVRGFRFGADDYVTKPFGIMELLARIDALLRRSALGGTAPDENDRPVVFDGIRIDPATRTVTRRGAAVQLRPKEFELLLALVRRNGRVVSRTDLLKEVWGYDDSVMSRTVDTHISELRRKLEDDPSDPRHILTVLKSGYRLRMEES
jgi:DNA-binding response OmpR family regulator